MKRKHAMHLILFAGLLVLTLGSFTNPYTAMFIWPDATKAMTSSAGSIHNDLYKKIKVFSAKHDIKPIDAKIDKIWKAIPGYNGLSVDIKASYKKMKQDGFDTEKIVYSEVPPNIHLNDLRPAPIYRGNPEKPMVSLLINVAWGNEYIPQILKMLNKYHIKATFFLDGSWTKKNADLAKMISEEGHDIGNHAYSHPDLNKRSKAETTEELKKTNDIIQATLDIKPKWFAPPSGSFNQQTVDTADQLGMKTILWTVDTVDWKNPSPVDMVRHVVTKVESGSMILMHPTKSAAAGLEDMIVGIKEKGYRFGTVSELMSEKRINR
ncbi:putative sporulation protein (polysaccharide deacetylase family) [Scopulibacillus darangshiensis]|uniref:Putative sporulation protein (Polysaccharide deacetylase family) n=1 Tax=Scopulibacillus darangshiensis TaxID=442528 RepID=A0A4R2P8V4_9BACL|nr:polysaccharide deacetylase family protein [Scopulibacillus darangshiensis]TCP30285.1 putative sporulation protein (polysaccharide deacetylase family) [Scopulibacillus darangshiensis]